MTFSLSTSTRYGSCYSKAFIALRMIRFLGIVNKIYLQLTSTALHLSLRRRRRRTLPLGRHLLRGWARTILPPVLYQSRAAHRYKANPRVTHQHGLDLVHRPPSYLGPFQRHLLPSLSRGESQRNFTRVINLYAAWLNSDSQISLIAPPVARAFQEYPRDPHKQPT